MKLLLTASCLAVAAISCAGEGRVEIGLNDEGQVAGLLGDLKIWIGKVELFDGQNYQAVWEGAAPVIVAVQSAEFISVTNGYETVLPGTYEGARVTVDSFQYITQSATTTISNTTRQFSATAFADIVIDDGDELRLLVNIASDNWFDTDSVRVKPGHQPFEGAALKIHYPL